MEYLGKFNYRGANVMVRAINHDDDGFNVDFDLTSPHGVIIDKSILSCADNVIIHQLTVDKILNGGLYE